MAIKNKTEEPEEVIQSIKFYKNQLVESEKYRDRKDIVSALLEEGKMYSFEEVDNLLDRYMKGKVM